MNQSNTSMIPPGAWLGLLGGGQLGRMFCMAAQSMGYKVAVLDPANDSPAGSVADRHIQADYLDAEALATLGQLCAAVTTEFENVPAQALQTLADYCLVSPAAESVKVAQDRVLEKSFVQSCGIPVAPYAVIQTPADFDAVDPNLFPAILKASRLGYDGKGQARVLDVTEAKAAFASMGQVPCVLEKRLPLKQEMSVIVARARNGEMVVYPVAENIHRHGILATSLIPAAVSDEMTAQAKQAALTIVKHMNYIGVLCVEFFVLADNSLVVNEMAPRPHNSGHYTLDAAVTSQFEQQARILANLPLGSTRLHTPAVMLNILGDVWFKGEVTQATEPDWAQTLKYNQAKLHLYGKSEARRARKMGHINVLGSTRDEALARALEIAQALGIESAAVAG
ncbi:5-(carboxyamino)imidazole ribonucleotide synthase [Parvibium lacunae]|uniref:N5-carboxyaminoimidazole ribonucleotide synthase n=1 Tax=Parvibium lacunae TaxID=1888893 RepID=A0A368L5A7_9BURK|nr:5-(carboxyamino)imidazole ribonucleotide synthase [Parvibium lacunae]RCS58330.1 5-(carboxyamino)imidazole ribonucleotide synthase [Parvibium lacunae]